MPSVITTRVERLDEAEARRYLSSYTGSSALPDRGQTATAAAGRYDGCGIERDSDGRLYRVTWYHAN